MSVEPVRSPVMQEIGGRIPPQALEMERAVLGAVMIDSDSFVRIRDVLDAACFYRPAHATIFLGMAELDSEHQPIDLLTMTEALRRMGKLEEIGGELYLSELTEAVPSSASIEYYAQHVLEKAVLRRIIALSAEMAGAGYEADARSEELLERLQTQLMQLIGQRRFGGPETIRAVMHETLGQIDTVKKRGGYVTGVGTGFHDLDDITTGFQDSELIIIAARPSMGKTALALNIAHNAAGLYEKGVVFFSLEMDRRQIAMRLLSGDAHIHGQRLRSSARLRDEEMLRLSDSCARLSDLPVYIDDTPGIGMTEIRARARQLWMQHHIGLVVLDYLQLVQPPKPVDNQQQWIAYVSASMKKLAKELRLPVVVLSQLSRGPEHRGGEHKPMLSDLRDSGAIEQDADVVLFVYRPALYPDLYKGKKYKFQNREYDVEGTAEIIVAKNRNGPTRSFVLSFVKEYAQFNNMAGEVPPTPDEDEPIAPDGTEQPF
ncbi:MAG: replicative DNA helicase [bacterium]